MRYDWDDDTRYVRVAKRKETAADVAKKLTAEGEIRHRLGRAHVMLKIGFIVIRGVARGVGLPRHEEQVDG